MAKLTAAARKNIPTSLFGLPETRGFPLEDKSHARAALSMLHNAAPAQQKKIKAKVHRLYPSIGMDPSKPCGLSSMCA